MTTKRFILQSMTLNQSMHLFHELIVITKSKSIREIGLYKTTLFSSFQLQASPQHKSSAGMAQIGIRSRSVTGDSVWGATQQWEADSNLQVGSEHGLKCRQRPHGVTSDWYEQPMQIPN